MASRKRLKKNDQKKRQRSQTRFLGEAVSGHWQAVG